MATKKTKKQLAAETNSASSLIKALNFISIAQHAKGTPNQTHCVLKDGRLTASDGVLTVGTKIEEQIETAAHTATLKLALAKCGQSMSMTQLNNAKLTIRSQTFKATVPCLELDQIALAEPDFALGGLNENLRTGFALLGEILGFEKERFISDCCIKLSPGSMVATNRFVAIEYWHGMNFPPNLLLPKLFTDAICKCKKPLKAFGFSAGSFTVWFEDDSYIKTQLYIEDFPDVEKLLNAASNPTPLPTGFYAALDMLLPFVDEQNNSVHFFKDLMRTAPNENEGASVELNGIPDGISFNGLFLKAIQPCVATIDFASAIKHSNLTAFFFGPSVRGAISGIHTAKK